MTVDTSILAFLKFYLQEQKTELTLFTFFLIFKVEFEEIGLLTYKWLTLPVSLCNPCIVKDNACKYKEY